MGPTFFKCFLFSSLMISQRQIISGSAGLIFAIFSPNESVLGVDDRSGPIFDISRDVAMTTILGPNLRKDLHSAPCYFKTGCTIVLRDARINSSTNCSTSCKNGENRFSSF